MSGTERDRKLQWTPFFAAVAFAAITAGVYFATTEDVSFIPMLQLFGCSLLLLVFPFVAKVTERPLPWEFGFLVLLHIVLAVDLGTVLEFYDRFSWWDLLMHGYFGFLGSMIASVFLLRWNGEALHPVGFLLIVMFIVMGCAAIWEIFEYLGDLWFGGDSLRVAESVAAGKSPVADTIEDMMIALAGVGAFYLLLFVDKIRHFPFCKRYYARILGCEYNEGDKRFEEMLERLRERRKSVSVGREDEEKK